VTAPIAAFRAPAAGTAAPRGRADPHLVAYLGVGCAALVGAVVIGRAELAAIAAPLVALGLWGVVDTSPPAPRAAAELLAARALEGDEVHGTVTVDWDGTAEIDVLVEGLPGVTAVEPAPTLGWSLPALAGPVTLGFRLRADTWGRHELGRVHVRARRPGGLVVWEHMVARGPTLRVLPGPLRLDALMRPSEPRAVAGAHLARVRGPGTDFAELRPYVPGDRLRDLSWAASARTGSPWVIVRHPERTGTVVLLLDGDLDGSAASTAALARAARAAWAVAEVHLRAQDRVGLYASGNATVWLPPIVGRRARWMLLDALLTVGGAAQSRRGTRLSGRVALPADALVVGITTLRSPVFTRQLLHHRRAGHTTAALVVDMSDLVPPPVGIVDAAAQRLWRAEVDVERHALGRAGVPTVVVVGDEVAPAVSTLRRATARHRVGRLHAGRAG
jgi:uncharacterized protein (DUF58 family)